MRTITLIILAILVSCCHSTRSLKGRIYELSDEEQKIQLNFLTDNFCKVEQSYECEKLPDKFRYLTLEAKYHLVKQKIRYSKNKNLAVELIVLKSLEPNPDKIPNMTYIPDYEKLCLQPVTVNSMEYKLREKIIPGVILNFVKDSLVIANDTIYFGYKKIPRKIEKTSR